MIEKLRIWDKGVVMRGALAGECAAVSRVLKPQKPRMRGRFWGFWGFKETKDTDVRCETVSFVALCAGKVANIAHGARRQKIAKVAPDCNVWRRSRSKGGEADFYGVKEPAKEAAMAG